MIVQPSFFTENWKPVLRDKDGFVTTEHPTVVVTSGGFAPIHEGHLDCIVESKNYGDLLVVIVNGNGFLERKKGFIYSDEKHRARLVDLLSPVDYVLIWDDGTPYVDGALQLIRPDVFTKGGDRRNDQSMPQQEINMCKDIGCKIIYGVGGFEKIMSSSELIANEQKFANLFNTMSV
jgi:cytidyltransferase-like protein